MPPEFAPVSVVIPAYQAAGTIGRALASVARQTLKPLEAVVVDDGSADGTFQAAEAMAGSMNGIGLTVLGHDHQGAGAARNRAIAETSAPYLAFLDADDEWFPTKLERTMAHMEGSDYVLVAHDYVTGEDTRQVHHRCALRFEEPGDPFHSLYRKGYIPSCAVVAKRDAVLTAGGFDPSLANAQDFDLWLAMLRRPGTPFLVFPEPLLRYHVTPGGIMSHTERRLECGLRIARRYFPDIKTRPGSALLSLWFRIAALHWEAISAYGARGNVSRVILTAGLFPLRFLMVTLVCLIRRPLRSRGFIGKRA